MFRLSLIAGNWKMHMTRYEARLLAEGVKSAVSFIENREVVLCPPFTALEIVSDVVKNSPVKLGAQNCFWEEKGAYTGEISPVMLKDLGCSYVILGHSERRKYFGETNEDINKKVKSVLNVGILPIICIGETLKELENNLTRTIVESQLREGLKNLSLSLAQKIVIAYEPVWAIGTGKNDCPSSANDTIGFIRSVLIELVGYEIASSVRILYGGSVKPENIAQFMTQPEIDGALVGGASLAAEGFIKIINWDKTHTTHIK